MMAAGTATLLPREPAERLDRRAVSIWRINNLLAAFVLILAIAAVAFILVRAMDQIADWLVIAGALALVTVTVLGVWYIPELDWRHWRYEIREEEIDIKRGWLTTTRTLVPISRVQHIDTQRSPVERRFRAATLIIHTAAGTVTIPALPDEVATSVGARITALANIHDDL